MITTLSRQARRRYPQFGNAWPQVVFISSRGTSATAEQFTDTITIAGLSLSNSIVIAGLRLDPDIIISSLETGSA